MPCWYSHRCPAGAAIVALLVRPSCQRPRSTRGFASALQGHRLVVAVSGVGPQGGPRSHPRLPPAGPARVLGRRPVLEAACGAQVRGGAPHCERHHAPASALAYACTARMRVCACVCTRMSRRAFADGCVYLRVCVHVCELGRGRRGCTKRMLEPDNLCPGHAACHSTGICHAQTLK